MVHRQLRFAVRPFSSRPFTFVFTKILPGALVTVLTTGASAKTGAVRSSGTSGSIPAGVTSSDWSGIRGAYEAARHRIVATGSGYRAENPGQVWNARFDGHGFLVEPRSAKGASWKWGLKLTGYGFGNSLRAASGTPVARAAGQRLTYRWDKNLQEWFVNDERGLEHGFTLARRPAGGGSSETLRVTLSVRGGLAPRVQADGRGVRFVDRTGATKLTYAGLKVFDADGKILPARFARAGGSASTIQMRVDERTARYPITIDPLAQQAFLKASNASAEDRFGYSVAISRDTAVVGAPGEDSSATGVNGTQFNEDASNSGAVYVFRKTNGTWTQEAYLKASNTGAGDGFGSSLSSGGNYIIVGAPGESSSATGSDGDGANDSATNSGAAYVFLRTGTTWAQQAYLKASNTGVGDGFGVSVGIYNEQAVVGAHREASDATGVNGNQANNSMGNAGAAYVFSLTGNTWAQQAYLKASNARAGDFFGSSVAIDGAHIVVGAPNESGASTGVNDDQTNDHTAAKPHESGAAYVFFNGGTPTWTQEAYLKASNTGRGDNFGTAVDVSGATIVVGARNEGSGATGVNGNQNLDIEPGAGAAYVFKKSTPGWYQEAYLKGSDTDPGGNFGASVAVLGNTAVVGAPGEDGLMDRDDADPYAFRSGTAYVFSRSGAAWSQKTYFKPGNPGSDARFGGAVALTEAGIIVGSDGNSGYGKGVDQPETNSGYPNSGAAYIFADFAAGAPDIAVEQPLVKPLVDGNSTINFGREKQGTTQNNGAANRTFIVRNSGKASLTGLAVSVTGANSADFALDAAGFSATLEPGNTASFIVSFGPKSYGTRTATLRIASNDADENPFDIALTGVGIETPSLVVTTTSDVTADDNLITLREALLTANTNGTGNVLTFSPAVFNTAKTISTTTPLPAITRDYTVDGPDAGTLTVLGGFVVDTGRRAIIRDLTISSGGFSTVPAVRNLGSVSVINCVLRVHDYGIYNDSTNLNSSALNCSFAGNSFGIYNTVKNVSFTATNCTFDNNTTGVNNAGGSLTLVQITAHGNRTAGIINTATLKVTNSTISGNVTGLNNRGVATLNNCIVTGNTTNLANRAPEAASRYNITSGTAAAAGLEVNSSGVPVLKNNGGLTKTIALVGPTGIAINGGVTALAQDASGNPLNTDQRGPGFARIKGGRVDIGAFERQNDAPVARPGTFTIHLNDGIAFPLVGTDPDNDQLTYVITTLPTRGSLYDGDSLATPITTAPYILTDSQHRIAFRGTELGRGSFSFRVNDGSQNSNVAIISYEVVDPDIPVITIDPSVSNNASLRSLPSTITGTYGDDDHAVTQLYLRLSRVTSGTREYWNPATQAWSATVSNVRAARNAQNGTYASSEPLPAGETLRNDTYTLTGIVKDADGNVGSATAVFTITGTSAPDTAPPTLTFSSITPNEQLTVMPGNFSGRVNDDGGISNVTTVYVRLSRNVTVNSTVQRQFWDRANRTWTSASAPIIPTTPDRPDASIFWRTAGGLPTGSEVIDGPYTVTALAKDAAGNLGSATVNFTIVSPPAQREARSSVQLSTAQAQSDGTIRLTFTGALGADATHTANYSVAGGGAGIVVTGATQPASNTVILATQGLAAGSQTTVAYELKDAGGRGISGKTTIAVK